MGKHKRSWNNADTGDGLKPHSAAGKCITYITVWENDNYIVEDRVGNDIYSGINKRLRRLNFWKCRKMNRYNNSRINRRQNG